MVRVSFVVCFVCFPFFIVPGTSTRSNIFISNSAKTRHLFLCARANNGHWRKGSPNFFREIKKSSKSVLNLVDAPYPMMTKK